MLVRIITGLVVLMLYLLSSELQAQGNTFRFKEAFRVDGQPTIAALQDRDGFIWLGSLSNGAVRFDGQNVRKFREGPGELSSNYVAQLFEDAEGLIWIGTDAGLNLYDKRSGTFQVFLHDPADPQSLVNNVFSFSGPTITQDASGDLWFGTAGGLSRYNKTTQRFTNYRHKTGDTTGLAGPSIWGLHADGQNIWIVYRDRGLSRLDIASGRFQHFVYDPKDANSLPVNDLIGISGDSTTLWLSSETQGLVRYDVLNQRFKHYSVTTNVPGGLPKLVVYVWKLMPDGRLLALQSTESVGLVFFDPVSEKTQIQLSKPGTPFSLNQGAISGAVIDVDGRFWVVNSSGIMQVSDERALSLALYKHAPNDANSMASDTPIPIFEDSLGQIWIGTFGSGLDLLDRTSGKFQHFKHSDTETPTLPHNYPSGFLEDSQGNFYVSTFNGLVLFDNRQHKVLRQLTDKTSFYTMREDPEDPNLIWANGWDQGLCQIHKHSGQFKCYRHDAKDPDSLANDISLRFIIDSDDPQVFWIPTWGGGLDRFDKRSGKFTHYRSERSDLNSISSNTVYDVLEDKEGRFWVATGNGFNRFDKRSGSFKRFMRSASFPATVVHNIQQDRLGLLWLATDVGLIRFDPEREQVLKVFTTEDGLHSNEFFNTSLAQSRDGKLWYGGFKGLNVLEPLQLPPPRKPLKVLLTALRQDGQDLPVGMALERLQNLKLPYDKSGFEFEFAAQNATNPAKNSYAYRLVGFDQAWQQLGNTRTGRYSRLPAGNYELQIKATNHDGITNEAALIIPIQVSTPYWQTSTFISLVIVCLLVLFYGLLRWRTAATMAANVHLELQVKARTTELSDTVARLRQTQRDLVESEKLASLGSLVAGVAHELNTPIGITLTAASTLEDHAQEFKLLLTESDITLSTLEEFVQHTIDMSELLVRSCNRAAKLITSFKQVAVDQTSEHRRSFNLLTLVNDNIAALGPTIKNPVWSIEVDIITDRECNSYPGPLGQVITNLIQNAAVHAFNNSTTGVLQIKGSLSDETVVLRVIDNGCGMSADVLGRIFDPFYTTRLGHGGSGLGLTICKNLVTGVLGGRLEVHSELGSGTEFVIMFPLIAPNQKVLSQS